MNNTTQTETKLFETVFCPGGQVMPSLPVTKPRNLDADDRLLIALIAALALIVPVAVACLAVSA